MKILYIITKSEMGGAQSVVISIVNSLCAEHEITVIAGEGDGKIFDAIDCRVNKIHYPCLCRAISIVNDIKTLCFLWKISWRLRPDIVHLHSSKAGLLGRLVFPKKKTIYTVHGFDSIRVAYRKLLPLERMMQWRCTAIIGVSQYDIVNLRKERINRNVHLVYNGIAKPYSSVSYSFPVPSSYKKVVMCIARVAKPKRCDIFVECAKRLPEYAFVWIGNMETMKDMPENTFFLGNLPQAGVLCQNADLFMLPSDYEGLPIAILEAMSHSLPVVASNVGGVSEIVHNGKNGYVLSNDNVDGFVSRIEEILQSDEVHQRFSKYSYELYIEKFTAEKMVSSYLDIYQSKA